MRSSICVIGAGAAVVALAIAGHAATSRPAVTRHAAAAFSTLRNRGHEVICYHGRGISAQLCAGSIEIAPGDSPSRQTLLTADRNILRRQTAHITQCHWRNAFPAR